MNSKFYFIGCLASLILSGCSSIASNTNILSDDKIKSSTAATLGYSKDDIVIIEKVIEGTNTYVSLRAKDKKEFKCVINGGNLLTFGMTNSPICGKRGEPINLTPFQR